MAHSDAASMGPVEVAVVHFTGNDFNGDVAPALIELQDAGIVRILDLVFIHKDDDDVVTVVEAKDQALHDAVQSLAADHLDLLSDEDVETFSAVLEPGSSALILAWENAWLARLAGAIRDSSGEVIYLQRIPHEAVERALAAMRA